MYVVPSPKSSSWRYEWQLLRGRCRWRQRENEGKGTRRRNDGGNSGMQKGSRLPPNPRNREKRGRRGGHAASWPMYYCGSQVPFWGNVEGAVRTCPCQLPDSNHGGITVQISKKGVPPSRCATHLAGQERPRLPGSQGIHGPRRPLLLSPQP